MILPAPQSGFEWRVRARGPVLVCTPLDTVAPHFFTTRAWALGAGVEAAESGWADVAASLGLEQGALARVRQVHGRAIFVAETPRHVSDPLPDADIVVGSRAGMGVAVQAADCVPLLIADCRLGVVAAAHAGWRGLALGVPRAAVEALAERFGSRPDDLLVALGPSIGACCYEVGPDVCQAFALAGFPIEQTQRWFHSEPTPSASNPSMSGVLSSGRHGHAYFDGWTAAADQLYAAGVAAGRIFSARLCTASHPSVFPSYRRDGPGAGRLAGVIRASPNP